MIFLSSYALQPAHSKGRLFPELPCPLRNDFQRDRDRLVHSTAFRRLSSKTQVFIPYEGDHYRTRLTHSIEVSQIARTIARVLGLQEDLTEAIALGHDLGHPCFGHAGEEMLNLCLHPWGGFNHNAQALRLVTHLEHPYPAFQGLNLTCETLEGLLKHSGPIKSSSFLTLLPESFMMHRDVYGFDLETYGSGEAQVAAIADDLAYHTHDIDDGIRAGFFSLEDLCALPLLKELVTEVVREHMFLSSSQHLPLILRRILTAFIYDVVEESRRCLAHYAIQTPEDVRKQSHPIVRSSSSFEELHRQIKAFLFEHVYHHPRLLEMQDHVGHIVRKLFEAFLERPDLLPLAWEERVKLTSSPARCIGDYIAGMTDRYALLEYQRVFKVSPPFPFCDLLFTGRLQES